MSKRKRNYHFAFFIAFRYLFSKKKQNAINVISFIAASGVCLGTLALVCVLSVFNGFESLVKNMFAYFDPDLKIEVVEGKTFCINTAEFEQIKAMDDVLYFSEVLEDNALIAYQNRQSPVVIKGIDKNQVIKKLNSMGLGNAATPLGLKAMTTLQKLNNKKDLANVAVFEGEKIITELSDEEISQIFSLGV